MKSIFLLASCAFLSCSQWGLFAQQGLVGSGGNSTGTGGTVSYSVGQIDYVSATATNGNIIQGLQQPFEISEVGISEIKGIDLYSAIYPNPSQGMLVLSVNNEDFDNLNYQVYDELGRLLENKRIDNTETTIDLSKNSNAKYILKISNKNEALKTYQILKQY